MISIVRSAWNITLASLPSKQGLKHGRSSDHLPPRTDSRFTSIKTRIETTITEEVEGIDFTLASLPSKQGLKQILMEPLGGAVRILSLHFHQNKD